MRSQTYGSLRLQHCPLQAANVCACLPVQLSTRCCLGCLTRSATVPARAAVRFCNRYTYMMYGTSGNQNCAKTRFTFNDILGFDRFTADEAWLDQAWENARWQNTYKAPIKANKGALSAFCKRKVRLCFAQCDARLRLASFLLLLPASCCFLLPASCCFLLPNASSFNDWPPS